MSVKESFAVPQEPGIYPVADGFEVWIKDYFLDNKETGSLDMMLWASNTMFDKPEVMKLFKQAKDIYTFHIQEKKNYFRETGMVEH